MKKTFRFVLVAFVMAMLISAFQLPFSWSDEDNIPKAKDNVKLKFRGQDWRKVDITFRDPGRRGAVDTTHTTGVYGPPRSEHEQFKSHYNPEQDVTGFGPPKKGGVYGPENPNERWPTVGPQAFFREASTPTAVVDSRNMGVSSGVLVTDRPAEADGYKSDGSQCELK